jgi:hypothetical protein
MLIRIEGSSSMTKTDFFLDKMGSLWMRTEAMRLHAASAVEITSPQGRRSQEPLRVPKNTLSPLFYIVPWDISVRSSKDVL